MRVGETAETSQRGGKVLQGCCRFCGTPLEHIFADLGVSPLANSYLEPADLKKMEPFYPLKVYVCNSCLLVQLEEVEKPEAIFSHYAYFSSYSDSWLEHAKNYAWKTIERFNLDKKSRVLEIGSNDGYLLSFFKEQEIPVTGIDPAENVAEVAKAKGIETWVNYFDQELAEELVAAGKKADLLVGNNVLAHIPNLNNLLRGMKKVLKPGGVISLEFPGLLSLIEKRQFDTIYHEHYSYFSLTSAVKVFSSHGLEIIEVEELATHGGSLRIFACRKEDKNIPVGALGATADTLMTGKRRVQELLALEEKRGLTNLETYKAFSEQVKTAKKEILKFLIGATEQGSRVAAYGAPAKGNTLLNYCGIGPELIEFTVDRSPHKQGRYLPGSHIPVLAPEMVDQKRPDYLVVLPWNLTGEITNQMEYIRQWNGRFVIFVPEINVF